VEDLVITTSANLTGQRSFLAACAGTFIGGGDWSEDRLIPDSMRTRQTGQFLQIRRLQAIRPWQYVG